jgi:hypothetical protein
MQKPPALVLFVVAIGVVLLGGVVAIAKRPFPPDTVPEGAYARIALAVAQRRPRDAFAYLETEAQWACYTIRDTRKKATLAIAAAYPHGERERMLEAWGPEASAPDGADVFALIAARRGWVERLERDLSGAASVDVQGERATIVTARGTRYPFRRRDNGIWGLTIFTAELLSDAERATRDLAMVEAAAKDYEAERPVP